MGGRIMQLTIKTTADLEAEQVAKGREKARAEALSYLRETDWMVVRFTETGRPVPDDVALRREEAREAARKLSVIA